MGWTDSHLHGFSSDGGRFDRDAEIYLTDFDVEQGDEGVPERDVRLDELLQGPADELQLPGLRIGFAVSRRSGRRRVRARR